MEFPSILFFSISYIISSISCAIGLYILFSSASDAGHPLSIIKYAIAYCMSLSIFTSATYAFLVRPPLGNWPPNTPIDFGSILTKVEEALFSKVFVPLLIVLVPLYFLSWILDAVWFIVIIPSLLLFSISYIRTCRKTNSHLVRINVDHAYCWGFLSAIFAELAATSLGYYLLSIVICYFLYIYISLLLLTTYIAFKERFVVLDTSPSLRWIYRRRKIMEFTIGMVGTIFFQFFLRVTSTIQIVAFLCLVVAWLGTLAMLQPPTDLGIFNFLLVNACLSCAVNIFKLRLYTWLVFVVCILLYVLRCKLVIVELRYDGFFGVTRSRPPLLPETVPLSRSSSSSSSTEPDVVDLVLPVIVPLSRSSSSSQPDVVDPVLPQTTLLSSSSLSSIDVAPILLLPQTQPLSPPSPSSTAHDRAPSPRTSPSDTLTHHPTLARSSSINSDNLSPPFLSASASPERSPLH